jgi:hypothetical protein
MCIDLPHCMHIYLPCQITSIIIPSISSRSSKVLSVGSSTSVSLNDGPQGTPPDPGSATLVLLPTLTDEMPAERPVSGTADELAELPAWSLLAV